MGTPDDENLASVRAVEDVGVPAQGGAVAGSRGDVEAPSGHRAAHKIIRGLQDAIAFAKGDTSRGRISSHLLTRELPRQGEG